MTSKEAQEFIEFMIEYRKNLNTKQKAFDFLVKVGIYNKDGTMNENYR